MFCFINFFYFLEFNGGVGLQPLWHTLDLPLLWFSFIESSFFLSEVDFYIILKSNNRFEAHNIPHQSEFSYRKRWARNIFSQDFYTKIPGLFIQGNNLTKDRFVVGGICGGRGWLTFFYKSSSNSTNKNFLNFKHKNNESANNSLQISRGVGD